MQDDILERADRFLAAYKTALARGSKTQKDEHQKGLQTISNIFGIIKDLRDEVEKLKESEVKVFKDGFYRANDCSICNSPIGYVVEQGQPYFDTHCDCMSYRMSQPQPRSHEEFKEFLAKRAQPKQEQDDASTHR